VIRSPGGVVAAPADLPAKIEARRLCEDLETVPYRLCKWIMDGAVQRAEGPPNFNVDFTTLPGPRLYS
jgi:hypothetical protein